MRIITATLAILACYCLRPSSLLAVDQRPVDIGQLQKLIASSDEIVVRDFFPDTQKPIYSSKDPNDIRAFAEALQIVKPDGWFHCMCVGDPEVVIRKEGADLFTMTNHHGATVRTSLWDSDAAISDPDKWVQWFADRGIPGPRKELLESREDRTRGAENYTRWLAAMPPVLKPVWVKAFTDGIEANSELLKEVLDEHRASTDVTILALLEWYGSGAGPWSGYPSYESSAEELLLTFSTSELLEAIQSRKLSERQTEGAARLFGGWRFNKDRAADAALLSPALRAMLWAHTKDTKDKDKYGRAKRAFK